MEQPDIIEGTPQELLPRLQHLPSEQRYRLIPLPNSQDDPKPFYETATADEWIASLKNWAQSHSSNTPFLSDYAVSRDSIYEGCGE